MSYIDSLLAIKSKITLAGVPRELIFVEELPEIFIDEKVSEHPAALIQYLESTPKIFGVAGTTTDVYWNFKITLMQQESADEFDMLGTDDSLLKLAAAIEQQLWYSTLGISDINFIKHVSTERTDEFEPLKAVTLIFQAYESRGVC